MSELAHRIRRIIGWCLVWWGASVLGNATFAKEIRAMIDAIDNGQPLPPPPGDAA